MIINTTLLNNIEFLKEKSFFLKEAIEIVKNELKPLGLDIVEMEDKILQKAIKKIEGKTALFIYDNKHLDKNEFILIHNNINIEDVDICSCCNTILMPDDELYEDSLNDSVSLCDGCSVFNENANNYENIYKIFDEVLIVKDDILQTIFCDYDNYIVPTYSEFVDVGEFLPNWQLDEEYQDYSHKSLKNKIDELCENFFTTLNVLNSNIEQNKKQKKYNHRTTIEYGVPIELLSNLQQLHNIYANTDLSKLNELILTQDSRTTEDYSSIEIILEVEINYSELSIYLKSNLHPKFYNEVNKLIDAIKEAKVDKYDTLHIYDC
ncbi:MAG: hypothetical protein PHE16_02940 [Aliarcobacter sp.]|nr:hypothetical protein [Aliarcobacter sp.]